MLRDVYDDMVLDGVQPGRDVFHSLIVGTMKGARLQDAFYFRDEMKAMGLVPDVSFPLPHPPSFLQLRFSVFFWFRFVPFWLIEIGVFNLIAYK